MYLKKGHALEQRFSEFEVHKNPLTGLLLLQIPEPMTGEGQIWAGTQESACFVPGDTVAGPHLRSPCSRDDTRNFPIYLLLSVARLAFSRITGKHGFSDCTFPSSPEVSGFFLVGFQDVVI